MTPDIPEHHLVVGAGVAGCVSAILRRIAGYEVTIIDKALSTTPDVYPVCTDTSTIVSENHSGAEYPFDAASGADCLDGRIANERFFPNLIYGGKSRTRIIASDRMSRGAENIRQQCRLSLARLQEHYRRRVVEDPDNLVLGDPDEFVVEFAGGPDGVQDASATFVTPQNGINPTYTAAVLEVGLRGLGVQFRQGATVRRIMPHARDRYLVSWDSAPDGPDQQVFDQVCVAASINGFSLATELNPDIGLPTIYFALRQILLMRLPDAAPTSRDFTCLKLEHEHGGMFSPFNPHDILVYYPPQAHIAVAEMQPGGQVPSDYQDVLNDRNPHPDGGTERTIKSLSRYYPELADAALAEVYHKIAINTVNDPRIRRNMGAFTVAPGCTLMVLPKWTMAVRNALRDVELALDESVRRGHIAAETAAVRVAELTRYRVAVPEEWTSNVDLLRERARHHATNMRLPVTVADSFLTGSALPANPYATHHRTSSHDRYSNPI